MSFRFERELHTRGAKIQWRHPRSSVVTLVLLPAVIGLFFALQITNSLKSSGGTDYRGLFVLMWIAVTAFNSWWILSGTTLEFDRQADVIRRGLQRLGRVSEVQAVERTSDLRSPLAVVLASPAGAIRRVDLSGVAASSVVSIGGTLAEMLGVAFR